MHYVNWKKLLILILVATSSLGVNGCQTGEVPELKNKPPLWGANSKYETLYRKTAKDQYSYVACKDQKFDEYICITKESYVIAEKEIIDIIGQCEKWK